MSYNSKYSGQEVEDLLDQVKNGGVGGGSSVYPMVDHGISDTTFELTPNTFHVWGKVEELNLTLGEEVAGVANEYLFQFTSGEAPTTLILPFYIKLPKGISFGVDSNEVYQISILNNKASILAYNYLNNFSVNGDVYEYKDGMTWAEFVESEYNTTNLFSFDEDEGVVRYYVKTNETDNAIRYNWDFPSKNSLILPVPYIAD